jgi:hypothetical protein
VGVDIDVAIGVGDRLDDSGELLEATVVEMVGAVGPRARPWRALAIAARDRPVLVCPLAELYEFGVLAAEHVEVDLRGAALRLAALWLPPSLLRLSPLDLEEACLLVGHHR